MKHVDPEEERMLVPFGNKSLDNMTEDDKKDGEAPDFIIEGIALHRPYFDKIIRRVRSTRHPSRGDSGGTIRNPAEITQKETLSLCFL